MEVDRRVFLATLGVGALELMSPEDKAEALEHYMEEKLDAEIAARDGTEPVLYMPDGEAIALTELQQENPRPPRGTGSLFMPRSREFAPMSDKPTLVEFFEKRFAPANHVLQSATHALDTGQPERTIFACLMHDVVLNLIKVDHGWWGAQLIEPYVVERISWGIRYMLHCDSIPTSLLAMNTPKCITASSEKTTYRTHTSNKHTSMPRITPTTWKPV